ncbi:TIGR03943 family protein [Lachnospiraceae bacterium RM5]|nr:TIGR03943 family protein [Lachnospiraceae bacterium RM5]
MFNRNKEREVPVYLFTGIIESGKTSFIRDTLNDKNFLNGDKILLIVCEEGIEEYDEVAMAKNNIAVEYVEEKEKLTEEFFKKCDEFHNPDRVMIEYNGVWSMDAIDEDNMPDDWMLVQVISTVDFTTFNAYWKNMRAFMIEQLSLSDMIIMNRCTDQTKRNEFRRCVKLFNKKAQIGYEAMEGYEDALAEEELPFDINADIIEIEDDDYGVWFMDVMDNAKKYDNKTVKFNALTYRPPNYPNNKMVPGRFAMTCCADDIQFLGMVCKCDSDVDFKDKEWITITAKIKREFLKEYKGKGPVLYLIDAKRSEKPDDDLVYF